MVNSTLPDYKLDWGKAFENTAGKSFVGPVIEGNALCHRCKYFYWYENNGIPPGP